jgi:hypothetical protein
MKGKQSGPDSQQDVWDFLLSEPPRSGLEATQLTEGRITGSKAVRSRCDHSLPYADELNMSAAICSFPIWLLGAVPN